MRRIGTEGGGAGGLKPLVPEELKADVHKLGRRIKNMNAFLLDPKSKFMQIWDFFTLSALFFTTRSFLLGGISSIPDDPTFLFHQKIFLR